MQIGYPADLSRPAISEKRMSLTSAGNIRYKLKTPYSDGTTHVIIEPLDFISKLASLVPKPRVNLTRFHGVFAPNSKHRSLVTPARRGKSLQKENKMPVEKRRTMTGFCSCKTDIYAIHGKNLGSTVETRVQH